MGHRMLSPYGAAVLVGFTGFFFFLNTAYRGPWTSKFDMPALTKERTKHIPEFAALFTPDSHPALRKNREQ